MRCGDTQSPLGDAGVTGGQLRTEKRHWTTAPWRVYLIGAPFDAKTL
jgi:hypothetical protein